MAAAVTAAGRDPPAVPAAVGAPEPIQQPLQFDAASFWRVPRDSSDLQQLARTETVPHASEADLHRCTKAQRACQLVDTSKPSVIGFQADAGHGQEQTSEATPMAGSGLMPSLPFFSTPRLSAFPEEKDADETGYEQLLKNWGFYEQESYMEPSAPASFRPNIENLFFAQLQRPGTQRGAQASRHNESKPLSSTQRHVVSPLEHDPLPPTPRPSIGVVETTLVPMCPTSEGNAHSRRASEAFSR